MTRKKAVKRATKTYNVIVKTAPENMEMVDFLMKSFETRFKKEFIEHGSVTVMEDVTEETLRKYKE